MPIAPSTDSTKLPSETLLVVIDMQRDFVTGSLGSPEAQAILSAMCEKIEKHKGPVWYTLDTHGQDYMETKEGLHLPVPHCIKGTQGHDLVPELVPLLKDATCFEKPTFGSIELGKELLSHPEIGKVELVGVCTDICVVSNALLIKAFRPELEVGVDSLCCAGTSVIAHEAALKTMLSCQIAVI